MNSFILFGANNPTGSSFLQISRDCNIEVWGRSRPSVSDVAYRYCDLTSDDLTEIPVLDGVIISFSPIWHLAKFLKRILKVKPEALQGLKGVIACSSSSFMTKRFAYNSFDIRLAERLNESQASLQSTFHSLGIPIQILAPTLIYGENNGIQDKNLSTIIKVMRLTPIIFMPRSSGLRQPIHAKQLAAVAKHQAIKMHEGKWTDSDPMVIAIGGDDIMTYFEMICRVRNALDKSDTARLCTVVQLSPRIFYALCTPLILVDPKRFESLLRLSSNLSGFTRCHEILGKDPCSFPVLPLAVGS